MQCFITYLFFVDTGMLLGMPSLVNLVVLFQGLGVLTADQKTIAHTLNHSVPSHTTIRHD